MSGFDVSRIGPHKSRTRRWLRFGAALEYREFLRPDPTPAPEHEQKPLTGDKVILELPRDWSVRDRGWRGTCVAFAATACVELYLFQKNQDLEQLSEQFLEYQTAISKPAQGRPSQNRIWLEDVVNVLKDQGICNRALCPYDPIDTVPPRKMADHTPPSQAARDDAGTRRIEAKDVKFFGGDQSARGHAADLLDALRKNKAAAITIPVYSASHSGDDHDNWTTPLARGLGIVSDPDDKWEPWKPSDPIPEGHAACVVGFHPDSGERMGGWFIVRNSWGARWATDVPSAQPFAIPVPGVGYGAISANYVDRFCSEMLILGADDST